MKIKRLFCILLILCFALGLAPVAAHAWKGEYFMTILVQAGESIAVFNENIIRSGITSNEIFVTASRDADYDIVFPRTPIPQVRSRTIRPRW